MQYVSGEPNKPIADQRNGRTNPSPARPPLQLAPMAAFVVIAAVVIESAARHPNGPRMRRPSPISGHPDVMPTPIPKAINPNVAGSRRVTNDSDNGGWRRSLLPKPTPEPALTKMFVSYRPPAFLNAQGRDAVAGLHRALMRRNLHEVSNDCDFVDLVVEYLLRQVMDDANGRAHGTVGQCYRNENDAHGTRRPKREYAS